MGGMVQILIVLAGIYVIVKRKVAVSSKSNLVGKNAMLAGIIIVLFGLGLSPVLDTNSLSIISTFFFGFILILAILIYIRKQPA